MNGWPEWGIISVASVDMLAKHAGGGTRSIVKGTGDHNAIVELEESEDEAFDLALVLAKRTKHDVYVLLLKIHTSLEDREAFVVPPRGQPRRLAEDPGDVAVRLGCVLPKPPEIPNINHRALVAIGLSIDKVAGIVGDGYRCVVSPRGVAMYPAAAELAISEQDRISTLFPEAIVYSVNVQWDPLELGVVARRGEKEIGWFLWPVTEDDFEGDDSDVPLWKEVEGETEPRQILAKLGVDPKLLGDVSKSAGIE